MFPEACSDLLTADHTDLCLYLNEQIRQVNDQVRQMRLQPAITAIISGLIGVFAAGLTAWLTHLGSSKLKKTDRFNAGQRQALIDCQEAALELRTRLIQWSAYWKDSSDPLLARRRAKEDPFPDHAQEELTGRLTAHTSRVSEEKVRTALMNWSEYAQLMYSGSDQHNLAEERALWGKAVEESGNELTRLDK